MSAGFGLGADDAAVEADVGGAGALKWPWPPLLRRARAAINGLGGAGAGAGAGAAVAGGVRARGFENSVALALETAAAVLSLTVTDGGVAAVTGVPASESALALEGTGGDGCARPTNGTPRPMQLAGPSGMATSGSGIAAGGDDA